MSTVYFLVQQMMFFSIPLLVVALGGMFSERSGVVNIALEGIMIMGAFSSILFINLMQEGGINLPPQLLLVLAILIAAAVGVVVSLLHAYAAINMKADQVISGTAINMFAPAFAIFVARMIRTVQQVPSRTPSVWRRCLCWVIFLCWGRCCSRMHTSPHTWALPFWRWRLSCCIRLSSACACAPAANTRRRRIP